MTKNKKLNNLPNWDLSDFYPSISSPKINEDFKKSADLAEKFKKNYQGKLAKISAADLAKAIKEYEKISEILGKISSFAYLNYATNLKSPKDTGFYQNVSEKINEISSALIFFELEINQIEDKKLQALIKENKDLQRYQPYLRDVRVFKKYQLSEELEKLLLEKSSTGAAAWSRLFDETLGGLEFSYDKKILNCSQIFDLMSNKDEKIRRKAAKVIGETLKKNIKILAYITNILAKDKDISDKWRGFEKPISSRNLSNFIEDEVVDSLVKTVKKNYPDISHRYYKIKAKILGKKKLHYSDRNAPISAAENKIIAWDEAKEIVTSAYHSFSPKLAKLGQKFFENNWIDVGVKDGKDSGAFAHPTVPSVHPYLMLNYQGKVRDVMTLAHELGHGVHQILSAKQGYLMAGTPLTLAETASVFGEQLTFQEILKREKNSEKRKLIIASKVEDMINTVVRQVAFLEFERKVHDARKNGEIEVEKLNQFWMESAKESLGDIFTFDEEYKYYWSYIPHFIHSPFYVYSYAFGDCLVNSLYGVYQSGLKGFEDKYFQMLEAGGTLHHKDLLAPFGLDASKGDFWQKGLNVIISYIDQLENE
ncbi:MAG: oligoendopeptidase [Rickettsiaceae bacterium]|jgi:oligoendopeptidase F|nr:oligoendopeptidase [Rickettsiaceae bacterium]